MAKPNKSYKGMKGGKGMKISVKITKSKPKRVAKCKTSKEKNGPKKFTKRG